MIALKMSVVNLIFEIFYRSSVPFFLKKREVSVRKGPVMSGCSVGLDSVLTELEAFIKVSQNSQEQSSISHEHPEQQFGFDLSSSRPGIDDNYKYVLFIVLNGFFMLI